MVCLWLDSVAVEHEGCRVAFFWKVVVLCLLIVQHTINMNCEAHGQTFETAALRCGVEKADLTTPSVSDLGDATSQRKQERSVSFSSCCVCTQ